MKGSLRTYKMLPPMRLETEPPFPRCLNWMMRIKIEALFHVTIDVSQIISKTAFDRFSFLRGLNTSM